MSADEIERLLLDRLRLWSGKLESDWTTLLQYLRRLEVHPHALRVHIDPPSHERWELRIDDADRVEIFADRSMQVTISATISTRGGRAWISTSQQTMRVAPDKTLVSGLRQAHGTLRDCGIDLLDRSASFAEAKGVDDPYDRARAALAFLAPDIQATILAGRHPRGMLLADLLKADLPLCWNAQRRMLGFLSQSEQA